MSKEEMLLKGHQSEATEEKAETEEDVCDSTEKTQSKQQLDTALNPKIVLIRGNVLLSTPGPERNQNHTETPLIKGEIKQEIKEEPEEQSIKQEEEQLPLSVTESSGTSVKTEETSIHQVQFSNQAGFGSSSDPVPAPEPVLLFSTSEKTWSWFHKSWKLVNETGTNHETTVCWKGQTDYQEEPQGENLCSEPHLLSETELSTLNHTDDSYTRKKPYSCSICEKSFKLKATRDEHMTKHTKPLSCTVCKKTFTLRSTLFYHMRIHTGEKPYSCSLCSKAFVKHSYLTKHLRSHTGETPYSCSSCNKTFKHRTQLRLHARTHTGEKPYCCSVCDKRFYHKDKLTVHMRIHTGERPYSCSQCEKTFVRSYNLSCHMRTHTADRPFLCPTCGQGFRHDSGYRRHLRTHTGEKPHSCLHCTKMFARKSHLDKHLKTHGKQTP